MSRLLQLTTTALICLYLVSAEGVRHQKPTVVVDVDAGSDDAIAILLLLAAHKRGDIELKAITCVAGNTNVDNVAVNVLRLLEAASAMDIPVYKGATEGLVPAPDYNLEENIWHGKDGFGDLDYNGHVPDLNLIKSEHAVDALYKIVSEQPNKVSVIFLGPATNAALVMKLHPDFNDFVKDILVMGGNYKGIGNKSNAAEFNFGMDPEAIYIVLGKTKKKTVILPWETCLGLQISPAWRFDIMGAMDNPEMRLMNAVELSVQNLHNETHYLACDSACVAVWLKPDIIQESLTIQASVETSGRYTRGQMVLDHNGLYEPNVEIVTKMDVEDFKRLLLLAAGHEVTSDAH